MRSPYALDRLADHGVTSVPNGWTVSRVKYIATYRNGYPFKPDEWDAGGMPIIRIQNLTDQSAEPNRYQGSLDDSFKVRRGDMLISWSASLGLHTWKGEDGWLNQHIFKVNLNQELCAPLFFKWLATWFMGELQRDAHGSTMQHLTKDAFGSFPVILPPKYLQNQIAEGLQDRVSRIDELIDAKAKLLDSLSEKRRALVAHAVTRGLSSDAPMRESGVEWLGQVPAHWRVLPLRRLIRTLDQGWSPIASNLPAADGEYGVLKLSAIKNGAFLPEENKALLPSDDIPPGLGIQAGDVFLTRANTPSLVGDAAMAEEDHPNLVFSDLIYRLRTNPDLIDPRWLVLTLISDLGRRQIEAEAKGSSGSMVKLAQDQVLGLLMPVPPIGEQRTIVLQVNGAIQQLRQLSNVTRTTVELLTERRTSIIAKMVIGEELNS
jgi:type I restriction enzyme S subunit